jgi:hypothetical protein
MGGKVRISEEKWAAMGEHYLDGHTLKETADAYGISTMWLSKGLKARGVSVRQKFEPSNAAKAARLPPSQREKFGGPRTYTGAPRRIIIGGEHTDTYEKRF